MFRTESEKLVSDLKTVAHDAEELLMSTAGMAGEKAHEVRERLKTALDSTRDSISKMEGKARIGAKVADKIIRNHPYETLGVALGVGTLIGAIASRTMNKK